MVHIANYFPKVSINLGENNDRVTLTDLTRRFVIRESTLSDHVSYFDYFVEDGELPWMIADRYYNDPTLDWIIMMTNRIIDPFYEWPMSYNVFRRYIEKKYGSVENTLIENDERDRYLWVVTPHRVDVDGTVFQEETLVIDKDTYDNFRMTKMENETRRMTVFDQEEERNEARRRIKILDPEFVSTITSQAEDLIPR